MSSSVMRLHFRDLEVCLLHIFHILRLKFLDTAVTNKSVIAPSGDKHDYMSWAPYSWPNCTSVGNTTELAQEEVWTTCPYYTRDGLFNPDGRPINDVGAFQNLSDAMLYNAIVWNFAGTSSSLYSQRIGTKLDIFKTRGAPSHSVSTQFNSIHSDVLQRGSDGQTGSHTGVLDLKGFAKIASGILILRKGGSSDWTTDLDNQFKAWCSEYITWLEAASIALQEAVSTNNHGTFYCNQLVALKLIVNDVAGAKSVTQTYFNTLYQNHIDKSGEQTNAHIQKYAYPSSDVWNRTTSDGATIKDALDWAMGISPVELYPSIVAVGSVFGDPKSVCYDFVNKNDALLWQDPYFLWNQPFSGGSASATTSTGSGGTSSNGGTDKSAIFTVQASYTGLLSVVMSYILA
ncbi:hypothetical protein M422DRAFT_71747 [Sphaerobolus stellatus SS14]|uniref:Unplaced genomic scaffold SPHSTscaffold_272, whole genome shotgun sequence n=1 Tax=Sphaerobolus stellatus (strain SS14) TaxID=990650 RepID=A0A0C9TD17_SPHS4|nr:hypothetical protein M422DRAFT_71747 [Sphaerobolus stellatus SS14]